MYYGIVLPSVMQISEISENIIILTNLNDSQLLNLDTLHCRVDTDHNQFKSMSNKKLMRSNIKCIRFITLIYF